MKQPPALGTMALRSALSAAGVPAAAISTPTGVVAAAAQLGLRPASDVVAGAVARLSAMAARELESVSRSARRTRVTVDVTHDDDEDEDPDDADDADLDEPDDDDSDDSDSDESDEEESNTKHGHPLIIGRKTAMSNSTKAEELAANPAAALDAVVASMPPDDRAGFVASLAKAHARRATAGDAPPPKPLVRAAKAARAAFGETGIDPVAQWLARQK